MKEFFENDCLINLPITKDHAGNKFTGAMKNLMGLNFAPVNRTFHSGDFKTNPDDIDRLDQCIADLNLAVKPALCDRRRHEIHHHQRSLRAGRAGQRRRRSSPAWTGSPSTAIAPRSGALKGDEILMIKKGYEHGLGEIDLKKVRIREVAV